MPAASSLTESDAQRFRKRIEYEDALLNTRTSIVLTINGFAGVAASLSLPAFIRLVVAGIIILIDVWWITRALEASRFISRLSGRLRESPNTAPADEIFRWEVVDRPKRIGTTKFVAVVIPLVLVVGWVLAVGYFFFQRLGLCAR
jgi:hypothetical protein